VSVLELSGVGRSYPGSGDVLRDVELTVRDGELLVVVGPSGSGKSTLLQLMGLLDRPTTGSVRLAGHDTARLSDRQLSALRARRIGFVFQRFHLLDALTSVDNVATGLLYAGVPARERRRRAEGALERVGLGHRLRHRPSKLSGGERQRVAIARALVGEPSLILADEPTGNLDSRSGAAVMELLRDLHGTGSSIVVITHDRELAASMPRRVALLDGEIVRDERDEPRPALAPAPEPTPDDGAQPDAAGNGAVAEASR
jgi:putative ABC transport system ATP-binding protein